MDLYSIAIIIHIIGTVIGVGTVTINDILLLRAIGDRDMGAAYQKNAIFFSMFIWIGLLILIASGIYFVYTNPNFLKSEKVLTKLALVAVIFVNGLILNFLMHPKITKLTPDDWGNKTEELKKVVKLGMPFGVISSVSWYGVLILGAAGKQPWTSLQILTVYTFALIGGFISSIVVTNLKLKKSTT